MGCDFFYGGCLKDHKAQENVVRFAQQYFEDKFEGEIIVPEPEKTYLAEIHLEREPGDNAFTPQPRIEDPACPFDFYGLVPFPDSVDFFDRAQFVFHRCRKGSLAYENNREGMLVSLKRFPQDLLIPPDHVDEDVASGYDKRQIIVDDCGYLRNGGGYSFALLLNVIKLRWMPNLWMGDDYNNCQYVEKFIAHYSLSGRISRESVTYDECSEIFSKQLEFEKKQTKRMNW